MVTWPIRERRSCNDDRANQIRPNGRQHHERPTSLAIPDHAGFTVRFGMQVNDLLEKNCFRTSDVLNGLARYGLRQEAYKVAGVSRLECDTNLAVGLETPYAGSVPGTRIDDNKGPASWIDFNILRRYDPDEAIVDRTIERPSVDNKFHLEIQHVGRGLGEMFAILIAALAHHIPKQNASLRCID